MAWPDNTPVIDTTNFLNDSGTVTGASGARNELVTLINRLNQALDSIDAGDTPYTDNNSADLMKKLATGTANDICLLNSNGYPIRAAKTISTTLQNNNTTVPTGAAVKTYVDAEVAGASSFQASCLAIAGGTFASGNNILSVANTVGSPVWTITFSTHFANTSYLVLLTTEDTNGLGTNVEYASVESKTTSVLTVRSSANSVTTLSGVTALGVAVIGTLVA